MIAIEFPLVIKNPLNGSREHWAVKSRRAKTHGNATRWALIGAKTLPWAGNIQVSGPRTINVCLVRLFEGRSKLMDDDGLSAAFKHVRDAVAAYLGIDDGDPRIRFTYAQARGAAAVRIELSVESPAELEAE